MPQYMTIFTFTSHYPSEEGGCLIFNIPNILINKFFIKKRTSHRALSHLM